MLLPLFSGPAAEVCLGKQRHESVRLSPLIPSAPFFSVFLELSPGDQSVLPLYLSLADPPGDKIKKTGWAHVVRGSRAVQQRSVHSTYAWLLLSPSHSPFIFPLLWAQVLFTNASVVLRNLPALLSSWKHPSSPPQGGITWCSWSPASHKPICMQSCSVQSNR